jgi:hypothetical protein
VEAIGLWGKRFADPGLPDEHLDPKLLMWDMQRRLDARNLPDTRTVVLFRFSDARKGEQRFWLCASARVIDLCLTNPGFDVDLVVDTDVRTLTEVWTGRRTLRKCLRDRSITLDGSTALKRAFPDWLLLSVFAEAS